MKKYAALILAALCAALLLAGCTRFEEDKLSKADIAIVDASGNTVISYGMSKADVEKAFGETGTKSSTGDHMMYQSGQITVWYRDDKVVGFVCSNPEYSTPRGIKGGGNEVGSTAMQIRNAYGSKALNRLDSSITEGNQTFYYAYDLKARRVLPANQPRYDSKALKDQISISFLLDENGYVQNFSASDNLVGFYLR